MPTAFDGGAGVVDLFRQFDEDGDGMVSKSQMKDVLKRLEPDIWTERKCNLLFKAIDYNSDGRISFVEFFTWLLDSQAAMGPACKASMDSSKMEHSDGEVLSTLLIKVDKGSWVIKRDERDIALVNQMLSVPGFESVNHLNPDRGSVLHGAAAGGLLDICKMIANNAQFKHINHHNSAGFNALHVAAWCGHAEICSLLLDHPKFTEMNRSTTSQTSALDLAVTGDNLEACRVLVEHARYSAYNKGAIDYAKSNLDSAAFMFDDKPELKEKAKAMYELLMTVPELNGSNMQRRGSKAPDLQRRASKPHLAHLDPSRLEGRHAEPTSAGRRGSKK
jgi:hypothetical protein